MDASAAADSVLQAPIRSFDPQSSLSRASSFSKLNAQAPEFVPRSSSSSVSSSSSPSLSSSPLVSPPSSAADLAASFPIHRPPPFLHVFSGSPAAGWTCGYSSSVQVYTGPGGLLFDRQLQSPQNFSALAAAATEATAPVPSAAAVQVIPDAGPQSAPLKNGLSEDVSQKIVKQVEFYFSDVNLATTGFLFKIMAKDPEGYVPLSVVASIRKIKTFSKSLSELAAVLRTSSKLVVSDDGKKVKRLHPLTESEIEEVQSRIVIAENLPEDHCHQNLMKIFSAVGSVKSIRTCQPSPQSSNPKAAKAGGMNFSSKAHAFVEYESSEIADKAVTELNEGSNWRNCLKVGLLLKQTTKSAQARVRRLGHEGDPTFKEEDAVNELDDSMQPLNEPLEEHNHDKDGGPRKGRGRNNHGRGTNEHRYIGKGGGRARSSHNHMMRANTLGVNSSISENVEQPTVFKQPSGPRMPDGTRGFSMGRGKPLEMKIV